MNCSPEEKEDGVRGEEEAQGKGSTDEVDIYEPSFV